MKRTSAAHVIIHALWPGPGPPMFEAIDELVSAPRPEWIRPSQTVLRNSAKFLLRLKSDRIQSNLRQKIQLDRNLLRQRFTSLFFFIVVIIIGISAVIGISSRADGRQVILL